jgi:aconitate hydratase
VLGAWSNIANEYATKRYRSNLINWGMIPFVIDGTPSFTKGSQIFIPNIRTSIESGKGKIKAYICEEEIREITLRIDSLTEDERKIITSGSLINFHKNRIIE